MHQVGAGAAVGDRQVDAEGPEAPLASASSARSAYDAVRSSSRGAPKACTACVEVVAGAERADQLGDVHAGAAVDLGWVLLGQHVDSHVPNATPMPRDCGWRPLVTVTSMTVKRPKVLAIVLAGGEGKRLMPLTADRAKPAVPFAGIYRLIDFALSNVVNRGYLQVVVLTQYKSHSLDRHVTQTWRMSTMLGNYVTPVPAQQRVGKHWYLGSADAIFQSLNLIRDEKPDIVVVVGADHVYRMDFSQMVDQHVESGAACTVAAIRQPIALADQFGVIDVQPDDADPDPRVPREADRPGRAARQPRRGARVDGQLRLRRRRAGRGGHPRRDRPTAPSTTWAATSCRRSCAARRPASTTTRTTTCPARPTATAATGATSGRSASYYAAHMDVVSPLPVFNLYNFEWPIYTSYGPQPPAKLVQGADGNPAARRRGGALARASWSAAAPCTSRCCRRRCGSSAGAQVEDSVLMNGVRVGDGAVVRNAILDKNVVVPPGAEIGVDPEADEKRGFLVEDGLTVLGKDQQFPAERLEDHAGRAGGRGVRRRERGDRLVRVEAARVRAPPTARRRRAAPACRPSAAFRRPNAVRYAVMPATATTRGPRPRDQRHQLLRRRRGARRR